MNQQLIDYIKKELQRGVPLESTKNALMGIGWSDKDIKVAYSSLSTPSSSKFNKKFIFIPLIILLLLAGGAFAYISFISKPATTVLPVINTPAPTNTQVSNPTNPNTNPVIPVTPPVNPDIEKVTATMVEICQGYLTSNNALIIKNVSTLSVPIITNTKLSPISSCTVNNVRQLDANIIANVTIVPLVTTPTTTPPPTATPTPSIDMVFINEVGIWKFDTAASAKFTTDQNILKLSAGDPNGFVDLVVTGVVVSPVHAVVNNKNLKIVVTVKNAGTKTSDGGAPLVADLLGFSNETPTVGGNYEPVLPGDTSEWIWYPYKYNTVFNVSDTVGQKTIQIKLNPDHKVIENNYDNNTFTQALQVFAK
jgi:hypothetical protein